MNLNTNQIVSISEANQNFSRVARMADKLGELYILKTTNPNISWWNSKTILPLK